MLNYLERRELKERVEKATYLEKVSLVEEIVALGEEVLAEEDQRYIMEFLSRKNKEEILFCCDLPTAKAKDKYYNRGEFTERYNYGLWLVSLLCKLTNINIVWNKWLHEDIDAWYTNLKFA